MPSTSDITISVTIELAVYVSNTRFTKVPQPLTVASSIEKPITVLLPSEILNSAAPAAPPTEEEAPAEDEGLGAFPETPEELNESIQSDEPDEDDED